MGELFVQWKLGYTDKQMRDLPVSKFYQWVAFFKMADKKGWM